MGRVYLNEQLLVAASLASNHRTDDATDAACVKYGKPIPCEEFINGSFHVQWTGADQTDATAQVQVSDDPSASDASFSDKTGFLATLNAASGNKPISVDGNRVTERWYRLKIAHGTNLTGTVNAYCTMKG